MLNDETIIHPKLHHIGLLTGNKQRLLDWYQKVLGMRPINEVDNPTDAPADSAPSLLSRTSRNQTGNSRTGQLSIS